MCFWKINEELKYVETWPLSLKTASKYVSLTSYLHLKTSTYHQHADIMVRLPSSITVANIIALFPLINSFSLENNVSILLLLQFVIYTFLLVFTFTFDCVEFLNEQQLKSLKNIYNIATFCCSQNPNWKFANCVHSISNRQTLITKNYIFMFMTWQNLSLWECTDPVFSLSHQVTLYFISFYSFLQGQCTLINITVNAPVLAKRHIFNCCPMARC